VKDRQRVKQTILSKRSITEQEGAVRLFVNELKDELLEQFND
jgi:hypothetical protein